MIRTQFLVAAVVLLAMSADTARAKVIRVGAGAAGSIAAAMAGASPGDIVELPPGSYGESFLPADGVTIQGAGASQTVLSAAGTIIALDGGQDITIRGVTFEGKDPGESLIVLRGGSVAFEDCVFQGQCGVALELQGKGQQRISRCMFQNLPGTAIFATMLSDAVIRECLVSDTGQAGIFVKDGATPRIRYTLFQNSATNGVRVSSGGAPRFDTCLIRANSGHGATVEPGGDATFENCQFQGNAGCGASSRGGSLTIRRSVVRNNLQRGVEAIGGTLNLEDTTVLGHLNFQPAVLLDQYAKAALRGNFIVLNGFSGILAKGRSSAQIMANTFHGNRNEAMWLREVLGTTVQNNVISGQTSEKFGDGVRSQSPREVTTSGNVVFGNPHLNFAGVDPGPGDVIADPGFVNPGLLDFTVVSGSPAKGKGGLPDMARFDIPVFEPILDAREMPRDPETGPAPAPAVRHTEAGFLGASDTNPGPGQRSLPDAVPGPAPSILRPSATAPPVLTVFSEPPPKTDDRKITISWTVESAAAVQEFGLGLNNRTQLLVNASDTKQLRKRRVEFDPVAGRYTVNFELELAPGPNRVSLTATNANGTTSKEFTILRVRR